LFSNAVLGGAFPNGFGGIDLCSTSNRNHCQGGQGGGLTIGQADVGTRWQDGAAACGA